jgi:hypothetical protein
MLRVFTLQLVMGNPIIIRVLGLSLMGIKLRRETAATRYIV